MTDPTYNDESLHTPESRDRDARLVGHEPKGETMTDDPKCEPGCTSYYGGEKKHHRDCPYYPESLTKLNADRIEALLAERDALEAENARLQRALVTSAPAQIVPKVKPLVWEHHPAGLVASNGMGGSYIIDSRGPRPRWLKWPGGHGPDREGETVEDMQVAAQANHEARILSQIDMAPVTVQEAALVLKNAPELMEGWSEDGWVDICALAEQEAV